MFGEFISEYGWIIAIVIAIIIVIGFMASIYKVAKIDKALIITGGKEPVIKVSGGAFVVPIFRKADYFDLCMMTVRADKDEIKTKTAVPIIADWTAQIRPCINNPEKLRIAIISFKERGNEGIVTDVKLTLTGAVRDVVAFMTPEEILTDKEKFKQAIQASVADEMENMGLELVSLNIQDVTDSNGYYDNIASLDASDKRQAAEIKTAEVNRNTRQKKAEAAKAADIAETTAERETAIVKMEAELLQRAKRRDTDMQLAKFKAETDTANADADIAGELQATKRLREVEEQKGAVEVMKAEQANNAAKKQREVIVTKAEAEKQRLQIEAEAEANVKSIQAQNQVAVAEQHANAARTTARGDADVEVTRATARVDVAEQDAKAIKTKAEATASQTRAEGQAEADVTKAKAIAEAEGLKAQKLAEAEGIRAQKLAEADGIRAQKLAEAEGERALAEARAADGGVNFKIESLKIQAQAQIEIATATAKIMADVAQNAEFVNIGGGASSAGGQGGNVFIDTLCQIPSLMKVLNAQNEALNGEPVTDEIAKISDAVLSGVSKARATKIEGPTDETAISEQ